MITVDKAWKTNSWKTNQTDFFFVRVYKLLPINLGACKPIFYYFLYTTSEEKGYYEARFLSYRPRTKCSISQFFKTNCIYSIFRIIEARVDSLLAKPFKKFPKSPTRPAGSNFWQVPNLRRNFKRVTLQRYEEFIESIFY